MARAAGLDINAYVILGIGGQDRSETHARETARVISEMQPAVVRLRTFVPKINTPLLADVQAGRFADAQPPSGAGGNHGPPGGDHGRPPRLPATTTPTISKWPAICPRTGTPCSRRCAGPWPGTNPPSAPSSSARSKSGPATPFRGLCKKDSGRGARGFFVSSPCPYKKLSQTLFPYPYGGWEGSLRGGRGNWLQKSPGPPLKNCFQLFSRHGPDHFVAYRDGAVAAVVGLIGLDEAGQEARGQGAGPGVGGPRGLEGFEKLFNRGEGGGDHFPGQPHLGEAGPIEAVGPGLPVAKPLGGDRWGRRPGSGSGRPGSGPRPTRERSGVPGWRRPGRLRERGSGSKAARVSSGWVNHWKVALAMIRSYEPRMGASPSATSHETPAPGPRRRRAAVTKAASRSRATSRAAPLACLRRLVR